MVDTGVGTTWGGVEDKGATGAKGLREGGEKSMLDNEGDGDTTAAEDVNVDLATDAEDSNVGLATDTEDEEMCDEAILLGGRNSTLVTPVAATELDGKWEDIEEGERVEADLAVEVDVSVWVDVEVLSKVTSCVSERIMAVLFSHCTWRRSKRERWQSASRHEGAACTVRRNEESK